MSSLAVGCGVGEDDKLEPNDPNPNGVACTDAFKVTGTFTPGTPARPAEVPTGCWPVGTWTFTVSLDPTDDNILDVTGDDEPDRCGRVSGTEPARFDASYSFIVNRMDDGIGWVESYQMVGAVQEVDHIRWNDKILYRLKVSEGGGLKCEAGLELFSMDRTMYWNLKPGQEGTTIAGFGDFTLYKEPQEL